MDYDKFYKWLVSNKQMSNRSAKDVLSRCKRVCRITGSSQIDSNTDSIIEKNPEFNNCSIFIKSQLKRAVALHNEFLKG